LSPSPQARDVYIERIRVPGLRTFNSSIGNRMPVWNAAVGKTVLTYLEPKKLKKIVKKLREVLGFRRLGNEFMKTLE
jgi:DNA-binding IclR family transcriptional regulator